MAKGWARRTIAAIAAVFVLSFGPDHTAFAQAGSAGGTIGKQNKSVSGADQAPAPRSAPKPRKPTVVREAKPAGCGNFAGTWSWSGGLFGRNDTVFNRDGSATHKSGIVGTWVCRAGGEIYVDWKDWYKNRLKLSADGKTLENLEGGGVAFTR